MTDGGYSWEAALLGRKGAKMRCFLCGVLEMLGDRRMDGDARPDVCLGAFLAVRGGMVVLGRDFWGGGALAMRGDAVDLWIC